MQNRIVSDTSAAWANNAGAGTVVNIDVGQIAQGSIDALGCITVYNPSAESALTVTVAIKETLNGVARYGTLTTFGVLASSSRSAILQGLRYGEGIRFAISNDSLIGAAGAFTAYVRVREG